MKINVGMRRNARMMRCCGLNTESLITPVQAVCSECLHLLRTIELALSALIQRQRNRLKEESWSEIKEEPEDEEIEEEEQHEDAYMGGDVVEDESSIGRKESAERTKGREDESWEKTDMFDHELSKTPGRRGRTLPARGRHAKLYPRERCYMCEEMFSAR